MNYVTQEEHQEVLDRFRRYRNKAVTGYVVALLGIGTAVGLSNHALSESRSKGSVVRGVLCHQLTEKDIQLYKYLKEHPPGSHDVLGELITPKLKRESIERTAHEREEIGYAPRPKQCTVALTPDPYHK